VAIARTRFQADPTDPTTASKIELFEAEFGLHSSQAEVAFDWATKQYAAKHWDMAKPLAATKCEFWDGLF